MGHSSTPASGETLTVFKVAVVGASGYVGGELLRLLSGHPDVHIGSLTVGDSAGADLGRLQPHVVPLAERVLQETTPQSLAAHDVVFLALPPGHSGQLAAELAADVLVVDCGADHRLVNPAEWQAFYGTPAATTWTYGLPELANQRTALGSTQRIAAAGCFPASAALALGPAVAQALVSTDDVVIVAATGTSGAGRAVGPHLLSSEVLGSASAYGVGGVHRHTPEIEQNLRLAGAEAPVVSFTPVLVPMSRGILATCTAQVADGVGAADLRSAYEKVTADEAFWRLLPPGQWPKSQLVIGSNSAHVQVALDEHAGRVVAVCAIDNLTKGAAGGAIQCMNIALGLPETTGLTTIGVAP